MTVDPAKTYTATIDTSCGPIVVALDAKNSPKGVNNFVFLAREGFYDGLSWHRAVTNFVIQGGDPKGDGTGGPGYSVVTEWPKDAYKTGDLAWAKSGAEPAGSAGSQFFVTTGDPSPLNGTKQGSQYDYGYFGHVTSGLDNAKKIESLSPGDGAPTTPVYITKVTIKES
jgi:cyclophilin family peptidyl-prolyl cis-trans isomerase